MLKRAFTALIVIALGVSIAQVAMLSGFTQDAHALLPSFGRGLVSATFDDSWEGQYTYGLPSMNAHNVKGTMFTTTSFVDLDPTRLTMAQLHSFQAGGHEIASHQVDHVDPTTLTPAQLTYQLTASKAWLEARFGPVYDYASPFGTYDATTIAAIQKYYLSQRTVDDGYNSISNFDQYTLKVKHLFNTVTPADVAGWLAQAKADKTWLILVFHQIDLDTSLEPYGVTPTDFDAMMQNIQTSGVPSVTTKQALDELLPYFQKYSVTGSVAGGDGTVTPAQQSQDYGSTASLSMTPAPGFQVSSIIDNGIARPVANPYVISSVTRNHSVEVTFVHTTWYLAEGSTAWGFSDYMTIENPNAKPVAVDITYMPSDSPDVSQAVSLPPMSQTTVNPADLLGQKDFSTRVQSRDRTSAIAVDRTMSWTGTGAASPEAHNSIGVNAPAKNWFLPEGSSNWGFETWVLVQNPGLIDASIAITYMTETGGPMKVFHTVLAHSRATFSMVQDIGQQDSSVEVTSDIPVIAERSMYRFNRREGHESIGSTAPSTDYYLAEGTTAFGFTTYVLVQNPQAVPATVTITYMTPSGPKVQTPFKMPASSRQTVRVNGVAGVTNTDLSTHVHATVPIVAERSMYWGQGTALGEAGHDSIGVSQPHSVFYLPDGQSSAGRETFTLVQNPNTVGVSVAVSYLPAGGGRTLTVIATLAPNTRVTFAMKDTVPNGRASIVVASHTVGRKIIVERSMYWNGRGAGTDSIGGYSD
ncbi:MAG TPA: DUF5719 family protein [Candidatus Anoxymicrobiaceae bacterium]